MAGNVLSIDDFMSPDREACFIVNTWVTWDNLRAPKKQEWIEIRKYITAVDTTTTTNSKLPWKNKTTLPKLCQIRDNLFANYMASMFPRRKWLNWQADNSESNSKEKREAIENYATWLVDKPQFKTEMAKLVLDYIDTGNCFSMVEWFDTRSRDTNKTEAGYVGPRFVRISPYDIVFNPAAQTFEQSPKIIRSLVSLGEVKEMLDRFSTEETKSYYEDLYKYLRDIRETARTFEGSIEEKDAFYKVDGFSSFRDYLTGDFVEVLTFYGDLYDFESDTFLRNHIITVVDRHKIIDKRPNPTVLGYPSIFHCGWRIRQDNLWAMGPLDNLVGMQYRIDHIENMKADVFDLIAYPVLKITGYVDDFEWEPNARIHIGDPGSGGDVEMLAPPYQVLQANLEIQNLMAQMEEMSGSPKEAMGFRTPGEKTKFEVQRLENAASRIFQNKIAQFEEQQTERILNAELELARKNAASMEIGVFHNDLKFTTFQTLSAEDISGIGRLKPIAARHFAEKADLVQNLNSFSQSPIWEFVKVHFSSEQMAFLMEDMFDFADYKVVKPYVAITEQAEAQRLLQSAEEQTLMEAGTPSGIGEDSDEGIMNPMMMQLQQGVPVV